MLNERVNINVNVDFGDISSLTFPPPPGGRENNGVHLSSMIGKKMWGLVTWETG